MNISLLEAQLVFIFHYTKKLGVDSCINSLEVFERTALTVDDSDDIKFCTNFLEIRGEIEMINKDVKHLTRKTVVKRIIDFLTFRGGF